MFNVQMPDIHLCVYLRQPTLHQPPQQVLLYYYVPVAPLAQIVSNVMLGHTPIWQQVQHRAHHVAMENSQQLLELGLRHGLFYVVEYMSIFL